MSESELQRCIREEREAVEGFVFSEGPAMVEMGSYRAATDEAVRRAEVPQVYIDIAAERIAQDHQWGGPDHDDRHTVGDWRRFRAKFEDRATEAAFWGDADSDPNIPAARDALVKIAALAVAEIQWLDRIAAASVAQSEEAGCTVDWAHVAKQCREALGGPNGMVTLHRGALSLALVAVERLAITAGGARHGR